MSNVEMNNLSYYQMLMQIVSPFIQKPERREKPVNQLAGFVQLSESGILEDPKSHINEMIMVYLPTQYSAPVQARICKFRNGKVLVAWADSTGVEFAPYQIDNDNLVKVFREKSSEVMDTIVKLLSASGIDHVKERDAITFCESVYSIEEGENSVNIFRRERSVGRFQKNKAGIRSLIATCKHTDNKFFSTTNKRQPRASREHNEQLESLYDSICGSGTATVRISSIDF